MEAANSIHACVSSTSCRPAHVVRTHRRSSKTHAATLAPPAAPEHSKPGSALQGGVGDASHVHFKPSFLVGKGQAVGLHTDTSSWMQDLQPEPIVIELRPADVDPELENSTAQDRDQKLTPEQQPMQTVQQQNTSAHQHVTPTHHSAANVSLPQTAETQQGAINVPITHTQPSFASLLSLVQELQNQNANLTAQLDAMKQQQQSVQGFISNPGWDPIVQSMDTETLLHPQQAFYDTNPQDLHAHSDSTQQHVHEGTTQPQLGGSQRIQKGQNQLTYENVDSGGRLDMESNERLTDVRVINQQHVRHGFKAHSKVRHVKFQHEAIVAAQAARRNARYGSNTHATSVRFEDNKVTASLLLEQAAEAHATADSSVSAANSQVIQGIEAQDCRDTWVRVLNRLKNDRSGESLQRFIEQDHTLLCGTAEVLITGFEVCTSMTAGKSLRHRWNNPAVLQSVLSAIGTALISPPAIAANSNGSPATETASAPIHSLDSTGMHRLLRCCSALRYNNKHYLQACQHRIEVLLKERAEFDPPALVSCLLSLTRLLWAPDGTSNYSPESHSDAVSGIPSHNGRPNDMDNSHVSSSTEAGGCAYKSKPLRPGSTEDVRSPSSQYAAGSGPLLDRVVVLVAHVNLLNRLPPKNVVQLIWCFARVGYRSAKLINALQRHFSGPEVMTRYTADELCQVLHSFSKLTKRPVKSLAARLVSFIARLPLETLKVANVMQVYQALATWQVEIRRVNGSNRAVLHPAVADRRSKAKRAISGRHTATTTAVIDGTSSSDSLHTDTHSGSQSYQPGAMLQDDREFVAADDMFALERWLLHTLKKQQKMVESAEKDPSQTNRGVNQNVFMLGTPLFGSDSKSDTAALDQLSSHYSSSESTSMDGQQDRSHRNAHSRQRADSTTGAMQSAQGPHHNQAPEFASSNVPASSSHENNPESSQQSDASTPHITASQLCQLAGAASFVPGMTFQPLTSWLLLHAVCQDLLHCSMKDVQYLSHALSMLGESSGGVLWAAFKKCWSHQLPIESGAQTSKQRSTHQASSGSAQERVTEQGQPISPRTQWEEPSMYRHIAMVAYTISRLWPEGWIEAAPGSPARIRAETLTSWWRALLYKHILADTAHNSNTTQQGSQPQRRQQGGLAKAAQQGSSSPHSSQSTNSWRHQKMVTACLVLVLHTSCRMGFKEPTVFAEVCSMLVPFVRHLAPDQAVQLVHAVGRLRYMHPQLMQELETVACEKWASLPSGRGAKSEQVQGRDTRKALIQAYRPAAVHAAWSIVRLGGQPASLLSKLCQADSHKLQAMPAHELTLLAWSIAACGWQAPPGFLRSCGDLGSSHARDGTLRARDFLQLMWALAQTNTLSTKWLAVSNQALEEALASIDSNTPHALDMETYPPTMSSGAQRTHAMSTQHTAAPSPVDAGMQGSSLMNVDVLTVDSPASQQLHRPSVSRMQALGKVTDDSTAPKTDASLGPIDRLRWRASYNKAASSESADLPGHDDALTVMPPQSWPLMIRQLRRLLTRYPQAAAQVLQCYERLSAPLPPHIHTKLANLAGGNHQ